MEVSNQQQPACWSKVNWSNTYSQSASLKRGRIHGELWSLSLRVRVCVRWYMHECANDVESCDKKSMQWVVLAPCASGGMLTPKKHDYGWLWQTRMTTWNRSFLPLWKTIKWDEKAIPQKTKGRSSVDTGAWNLGTEQSDFVESNLCLMNWSRPDDRAGCLHISKSRCGEQLQLSTGGLLSRRPLTRSPCNAPDQHRWAGGTFWTPKRRSSVHSDRTWSSYCWVAVLPDLNKLTRGKRLWKWVSTFFDGHRNVKQKQERTTTSQHPPTHLFPHMRLTQNLQFAFHCSAVTRVS